MSGPISMQQAPSNPVSGGTKASIQMQDYDSGDDEDAEGEDDPSVLESQPDFTSTSLNPQLLQHVPINFEHSVYPSSSTPSQNPPNAFPSSSSSHNLRAHSSSNPRSNPNPTLIRSSNATNDQRQASYSETETKPPMERDQLKKAFERRIRDKNTTSTSRTASNSPSNSHSTRSPSIGGDTNDLFTPTGTATSTSAAGRLLEQVRRNASRNATGSRSGKQRGKDLSVEQLAERFLTRIQYASYKLSNGWSKQTLSELEGLHFKRSTSNGLLSYSTPTSSRTTPTLTPTFSFKGKERAHSELLESSNSLDMPLNRAQIAQMLARRGVAHTSSSSGTDFGSSTPARNQAYPFNPTPQSNSKAFASGSNTSGYENFRMTPNRGGDGWERTATGSITKGGNAYRSVALGSPSVLNSSSNFIRDSTASTIGDPALKDVDPASQESLDNLETPKLSSEHAALLDRMSKEVLSYNHGMLSNSRRGAGIKAKHERTNSLSPVPLISTSSNSKINEKTDTKLYEDSYSQKPNKKIKRVEEKKVENVAIHGISAGNRRNEGLINRIQPSIETITPRGITSIERPSSNLFGNSLTSQTRVSTATFTSNSLPNSPQIRSNQPQFASAIKNSNYSLNQSRNSGSPTKNPNQSGSPLVTSKNTPGGTSYSDFWSRFGTAGSNNPSPSKLNLSPTKVGNSNQRKSTNDGIGLEGATSKGGKRVGSESLDESHERKKRK